MIKLNYNITEKLLDKFYKKVGDKTLESVITGNKVYLNVELKERLYLVKDSKIMNSKEAKNFSINYKIESWFLKKLGLETYQKVHKNTSLLISQFLRLNPLQEVLKEEFKDEELIDSLVNAISSYKNKKKISKKIFKFMFLSKSPHAVEFLNSLCRICELKKEFLYYNVTNLTPEIKLEVLEKLDSHILNNNAEYRILEQ